MSLNLRQDLSNRAPVTAVAAHGEKLEILQTRRRFTRVRTSKGLEGWVDGRQLLSPQQMTALRRVAEQAAKLPSQGKATVYETLNVHTVPNRNAPSFAQVPEGGWAEVIGHQVAPRVSFQAPAAPPPPRKSRPARKPKASLPEKVRFELNLPKPPAPPSNWLEISRVVPGPGEKNPLEAQPAPPQPKMDDWSLVRLQDGKAGWVLSRALVMAIPDEVAQYAEGHRITSYFSLGEVRDGEQAKQHWLWTTLSANIQQYQYDSFRVFIYNTRRHRYETAYIERNLKGYFPVEAHPVDVASGKHSVTVAGFSVILEDKQGSVNRCSYAFEGYRVRRVKKTPYQREQEMVELPDNPAGTSVEEQPASSRTWKERALETFDGMRRKLWGK